MNLKQLYIECALSGNQATLWVPGNDWANAACWVRVPRFFLALCLFCTLSLGAPSIGSTQRLEFEATVNDSMWPPREEVSFEELCHGAAWQAIIEGYSRHVTCSITNREGGYVVVQLQVGATSDLHLFTQAGRRYRYVGSISSAQSEGNHSNDVRVLEIRPRTYLGETYVFLQVRHRTADYYSGTGEHQCSNEYLQICRPNIVTEPCENYVQTRRECDARPPQLPRMEESWWRARHVARSSITRADVEVSDEGLLRVTLREGTWQGVLGYAAPDPEGTQVTLRFAPEPPMPDPPPFIEGVCRAIHEDDWQNQCDDRPRTSRYPPSLQGHADFQALCDDARGSTMDITECSEERITRNLSIVRTRRVEDAGPTFLAMRRGRSIRLISRMSEPYPQRSELRFVRHVRGRGRYFGIEFEERTLDAPSTTRRHLLVCQQGREPRCSLRVPTRYSTQRPPDAQYGFGRLQVDPLSEAQTEIRRDGTLVLTRVSGSWVELFGIESPPPEDEERVIYRL